MSLPNSPRGLSSQQPRLTPAELRLRLGTAELFSGLDGAALLEIATDLEGVHLPGGATLFRQGDAADGLYLVLNGRLRVTVEDERGQEVLVGEVGRTETVGEMALLTARRRGATVCAIRDTDLVKLSHRAWDRLTAKWPGALRHVARVLALRLEEGNRSRHRVAPPHTITLVPIDPRVAISDFASRLASALAPLGSVLHLSSQRMEVMRGEAVAQIPPRVAGFDNIATWLNDQELQYRFILYQADATASGWTRRCLRQADRILVIARSDQAASLGEVESGLLAATTQSKLARIDLVLLHPEGSAPPTETRRWLEGRHVAEYYHVRWSAPGDFATLARLLTRRALGLVLGGGGVRGLAHIGVLRALREAGLQVDCIGGASMGAAMAAQYALGWDDDRMLRVNRKLWCDSWPMNDYTLPIMACLAGRKFDATLQAMFGEQRIEDMPMKFFCVSTDLTTASLVVHQDGLLWRRVRASSALPGIVPPEFDNGHMLVDGGLLRNLPADIMRTLCGGQVMVVDLSPVKEDAFTARRDRAPSVGRLLWSRVNPFAEREGVPTLFEIVARSAMISSLENSRLAREAADRYLHIPLERFRISEFKSFDEIVETGYRSAREQLAVWEVQEGQAEAQQ